MPQKIINRVQRFEVHFLAPLAAIQYLLILILPVSFVRSSDRCCDPCSELNIEIPPWTI
jgi:hypothetical protein